VKAKENVSHGSDSAGKMVERRVERKLRAAVPTAGLGEQTEIVVLVGGDGELCVECL